MEQLKKIFISHTHLDGQVVSNLLQIFDETKCQVFCSSHADHGIEWNEQIKSTLDKSIYECDYFIPIVTGHYVRKAFCIYEFAVASYLKKMNAAKNKEFTVLPIGTCEKVYKHCQPFLGEIGAYSVLAKNTSDVVKIKRLLKPYLIQNEAKVDELLNNFFQQLPSCDKDPIPFFADEGEYDNILNFCYKNGIQQITVNPCEAEIMLDNIQHAKEITLFATTGSGVLKQIKNALEVALLNKANIRVCIPNKNSDFIANVADIESLKLNNQPANLKRLADEYEQNLFFLREVYTSALAKLGRENIGKITVYCAQNCFRQTITMTKQDDIYWVWCSMTMPPARSIEGTPSFMIKGEDIPKSTINCIVRHCESIIKLSVMKNSVIEIDENTDNTKPFYLEPSSAKQYWVDKYEIAKANMEDETGEDKILIEVAAQHPLKNGNIPGVEYAKRLDQAINVYKTYKGKIPEVKLLIPGSIHVYKGIADKISLAKAGIDYLVSKGIDINDIYSEEEMNNLMVNGVYNSSDECEYASKIFYRDRFTKLICVCAPNQIQRKTLFYVELGIIPLCYGVPTNKMYHNVINEMFVNLPNIIYKDHIWSDPNCEAYINTRKERKPKQ